MMMLLFYLFTVHSQCPLIQMTDTDVTFLPNYNNMDPARLYVMIFTSRPSLPRLKAQGRLGVRWPSQTHPLTLKFKPILES